jgi:predicted DsbA family dithiol-disulfide isomerase
MAAFKQCFDSGKHREAVKASVARIQKMNISGTPMFLVGRTPSGSEPMTIAKIIEGAQPFEAFKAAIEELEAGK